MKRLRLWQNRLLFSFSKRRYCYYPSEGSEPDKFLYSKLANGIQILTNSRASGLNSVKMIIKSGPYYETHFNHGCSHYWRRFLYKSTNRISGLRRTRTIESVSSNFYVNGTCDEQIYFSEFKSEFLKDNIVLLADSLRPKLSEWEFLDVRKLIQHDRDKLQGNHPLIIDDHIRFIAFSGVGLGRSIICPQYNVNKLYPEDIADYILSRTTSKNIFFVGNVSDHGIFQECVKSAFDIFPDKTLTELYFYKPEKTVYTGGKLYESSQLESTYVEAYPCGSNTPRDELIQSILSEVIGRYNAFGVNNISRSPNKMMKLINSFPNLRSAEPFILSGPQSLFGIKAYGIGLCKDIAEKIHYIFEKLNSLTEQEFMQAKKIVEVRQSLLREKRKGLLEALRTVAKFPEELEDVTFNEAKERITQMLKQKPTIYANGNIYKMPNFLY